jgi:beta-glucosidase
MTTNALPRDFLWGVATSAQQIEGAWDEAGRGESIWDRFAATPGHIADGSDSSVACDHFHRWREDVDLLHWLGVNAYRFSVAWPRVFATGEGRVNASGLDFYEALVDRLLSFGIRPFLTLDHWDLPQALQDRGGWSARDTVGRFVEFADAVSARLGDRVTHWATHNEPWCVAHLGHEQGEHAPGLRSPAQALRVAHHLLLSHGSALPVLRRNAPGAEVGIVNLHVAVQPASAAPADVDAARQVDGSINRWYLDPLFGRGYPVDAIADRVRLGHLAGPELPFVEAGDLAIIGAPIDFLGINYYSRSVVRAGADGRPEAVPMAPPDERTAMGWEVYPAGLRASLLRVWKDYRPSRLYLTENGAAFEDEPAAEGPGPDVRRIDYLRGHIAAAADAIADGVPLHGYFVWSLMDNFEWSQGLAKRFGLFHVDYATGRRTARASARWYRELATRNALEAMVPGPGPGRQR